MKNSTLLGAALVAAATIGSPAPAAELTSLKNSARGVTVSVTPVSVAADARAWEFKVVLDTHSANLDDDLARSAILIDVAGRRHSPIAWDGAGPGGHHREGVLRFKPVSPRPQSIELQITRTGEDAPRVFRWVMN